MLRSTAAASARGCKDHLKIRHVFGVSGAATLNTVCGSKSGLRLGVYQKAQRKTKSLHPTVIAL